MHPINPRFIANLFYSLTPVFNKIKSGEKAPAIYAPSNTYRQLRASETHVIERFSLPTKHNKWRIKKRIDQKGTYSVRNHNIY